MAAGNKEEMDAAMRDRDFTQRNDENGWSYPLIFYDTTDTEEGPPTKKAKKGSTDGKRTIFVNRHGLAMYSPVFTKIFFDTSFVDASKPELVMTGRNFDDFLEFINCIAITYKSDNRKAVDIDNLELLLRFADEFAIGSLKDRCVAFIAQLIDTFKIDNVQKRDALGRLFIICKRTDNTALLPTDIASEKISRFPFREIKALDVDEQTKSDLLETKVERYNRLDRATEGPAEKFETSTQTSCDICERDFGHDAHIYTCNTCLDGDTYYYAYCLGCFDAHHVPAHAPGVHICPDCFHVFTISTYCRPDQCGCV